MGDISCYRKAADQIWDLAIEFEKEGEFKLAGDLKDIATKMHEKAHHEEVAND